MCTLVPRWCIQGHLQPPEDPWPAGRPEIAWGSCSSCLLHWGGAASFGRSLPFLMFPSFGGKLPRISQLPVTWQALASATSQDSPNRGHFLSLTMNLPAPRKVRSPEPDPQAGKSCSCWQNPRQGRPWPGVHSFPGAECCTGIGHRCAGCPPKVFSGYFDPLSVSNTNTSQFCIDNNGGRFGGWREP